MKFTFAHNNFNVVDLEKSLKFYEEALNLHEVRRKEAADGSFILVYLGDGATDYQLELTWLRDWEKESYNLGDNEFHLAFETDDMDASLKKHREIPFGELITHRFDKLEDYLYTIRKMPEEGYLKGAYIPKK